MTAVSSQFDTYVSYSNLTATSDLFTVAISNNPSVPVGVPCSWQVAIEKFGPGDCSGGDVTISVPALGTTDALGSLGSPGYYALTGIAPHLPAGYVEIEIRITGFTRSGGGFWSLSPNNDPYNSFWTALVPTPPPPATHYGFPMIWLNPKTGVVVESVGGDFLRYNEFSQPVCPGWRSTVVGGWQVWGEMPMVAGPPLMRVSFGGR
jgi:hypothetical protein